ncbi:hypothetical protein F0L68_12210 [Solihabitans fulvus]|uniref:Uncharacterized protein n=1 Tax=Solihabitans fulvus TaxID=1892852 RepID=A0A5B2XHK2_9PSEU|nr:hypothetical protein [Solihabitans fulvus]KAA2262654.1 hypothetical protein F0L68_12210 [Solihabitans fulvus]
MANSSENATGGNRGRRLKTVLAGIGVAIGAIALTGSAIAAFSIKGDGTASGKALGAGDLKALVFTEVANPAGDLLPGGQGAAAFTVANDNGFAVQVNKITLGGVTVRPVAGQTCGPENFSVPSGPITLATPLVVPAKATAQTGSIPNAISLSANAGDGCQGAAVVVAVTAIDAVTVAG